MGTLQREVKPDGITLPTMLEDVVNVVKLNGIRLNDIRLLDGLMHGSGCHSSGHGKASPLNSALALEVKLNHRLGFQPCFSWLSMSSRAACICRALTSYCEFHRQRTPAAEQDYQHATHWKLDPENSQRDS